MRARTDSGALALAVTAPIVADHVKPRRTLLKDGIPGVPRRPGTMDQDERWSETSLFHTKADPFAQKHTHELNLSELCWGSSMAVEGIVDVAECRNVSHFG